MNIRRKLGLHAMVGIRNLEKWNIIVGDACKEMDRREFHKAKVNMKTLMWYNTKFNYKGRVVPYVNGTKEAAVFFNVKAGSWVLKHEGSGYAKCPLCHERDSEIHRILKCKELKS